MPTRDAVECGTRRSANGDDGAGDGVGSGADARRKSGESLGNGGKRRRIAVFRRMNYGESGEVAGVDVVGLADSLVDRITNFLWSFGLKRWSTSYLNTAWHHC